MDNIIHRSFFLISAVKSVHELQMIFGSYELTLDLLWGHMMMETCMGFNSTPAAMFIRSAGALKVYLLKWERRPWGSSYVCLSYLFHFEETLQNDKLGNLSLTCSLTFVDISQFSSAMPLSFLYSCGLIICWYCCHHCWQFSISQLISGFSFPYELFCPCLYAYLDRIYQIDCLDNTLWGPVYSPAQATVGAVVFIHGTLSPGHSRLVWEQTQDPNWIN